MLLYWYGLHEYYVAVHCMLVQKYIDHHNMYGQHVDAEKACALNNKYSGGRYFCRNKDFRNDQ